MPASIYLFGESVLLYHLFPILALAVFLILGNILGKTYSFGVLKRIFYVLLTVALRSGLLTITSYIIGGGEYSGVNHVRIVVILPFVLLPITLLLKDDFWKVTDFIVPLLSIYHGIVCVGCIFTGCCHGYPSTWGLFSNQAGTICFPIQPIEIMVYILIGVVLLYMTKKKLQPGRLYAWYLVMFGFSRFFLEYLRDDKKIFIGLSEYAIEALVALLVGAVGVCVINSLHKRRKKIV